MSQFFRATFTRDGHKKLRHNRKWLDGFLKVQGCSTVLLTEEGTEIGSARLPDGTQLSEDSDELTCFGGSILVCVDAPCGAHELPGAAARAPTTAPAAEIGENVSAAANKLPPARPLPSTRPSGAGRKAFAAPRLSRPQQAAPTAGPSLQRPVQQQQQQQVALRAYPAPSAPTSRQPAAVAQHRLPVPAATSSAAAVSQAPQERTDDDILQLLLGVPPAAAQDPEHVQPAKRVKLPEAPASLAQRTRWASYEDSGTDSASVPAQAGPSLSKWAPVSGGISGLAGVQPNPAACAADAAGFVEGALSGLSGLAGDIDDWPDTGDEQQLVPAGPPQHLDSLNAGQRAGVDGVIAGGAHPRWAQQQQQQQQSWGGQRPQPVTWQSGQQPGQQVGAARGSTPLLKSRWAPPQGQHSRLSVPQQQQQQQQRGHQKTIAFQPPMHRLQQPSTSAHVVPASGATLAGRPSIPAAPRPGQLAFPGGGDSGRLARRVVIPDSFASGEEYASRWKLAIMEELNIKLAEVAQNFHSVSQRMLSGKQAGPGAGSALETKLRQCGVQYHANCELFIWKNLPKKQTSKKQWKRGKGKAAADEDGQDEDEDDLAKSKPESFYLILKSGRGKNSEFRKDDLWVISSSPQFQSGLAAGQVGDKARAPWVAIARSLWHGPNQDGKFEIELLTPRPPNLGRSQPVHAIRGPEASTELSMIELLQSLTPSSLPLLPNILGKPAPSSAALAGQSKLLPTPPAAACTAAAAAEHAGAAAGAQTSSTPPCPNKAGSHAPGMSVSSDSPSYSPSSPSDIEASPPARNAEEAAAAAAAAVADAEPDGQGEDSDWEAAAKRPQRKHARRGRQGGKGAAAGGAGSSKEGSPVQSAAMDAEALIARFRLNPEQAEVLLQVAAWCTPADQAAAPPPAPVCLVHGPFGSGKSTLLVAILHLLLQQRSKPSSSMAGIRVLVSAHTNVAVDRVLQGLLESGCTDFLRVGPLRRISRSLLRQSLHASESKAHASAAGELKDMLKEATDPHEAAVLRAELQQAERGAERQKKRLLKTVPVVGVTCCSALLPALDGQRFDVVLLDECSQMVEPLSMVPLARAGCRYLIAAGDPLQLPPVIATPAQVTPPPGAKPGSAHGLLRPLFVRMAALGHTPHLLRHQYRCHPAISQIPNEQFYGGRLLDGVSEMDRASLLPRLPSLVFLDVRGTEQYNTGSHSAANPQEASAVVSVVERLVQGGIRLGQVGVICFFRAQVALIRSQLDQHLPRWQQLQRQQQLDSSTETGGEVQPLDGLGMGQVDGGSSGKDCNEEAEGGDSRQNEAAAGYQVATVDSFQGAERDVIILSTTVTRPGSFAADSCRLNVALTRARHNLVVVGCAPALQQSAPALAALLRKCRAAPGGYSPGGRLPDQLPVEAAAVPAAGSARPTGPQGLAGPRQGPAAQAAVEEGDECEDDWEALEAAALADAEPPYDTGFRFGPAAEQAVPAVPAGAVPVSECGRGGEAEAGLGQQQQQQQHGDEQEVLDEDGDWSMSEAPALALPESAATAAAAAGLETEAPSAAEWAAGWQQDEEEEEEEVPSFDLL